MYCRDRCRCCSCVFFFFCCCCCKIVTLLGCRITRYWFNILGLSLVLYELVALLLYPQGQKKELSYLIQHHGILTSRLRYMYTAYLPHLTNRLFSWLPFSRSFWSTNSPCVHARRRSLTSQCPHLGQRSDFIVFRPSSSDTRRTESDMRDAPSCVLHTSLQLPRAVRLSCHCLLMNVQIPAQLQIAAYYIMHT